MRERWSDERLDDLKMTVEQTHVRTSDLRRRVDRHDQDLKRIAATGDRRSQRRWDLAVALSLLAAGQIGTLIVTLVHHG